MASHDSYARKIVVRYVNNGSGTDSGAGDAQAKTLDRISVTGVRVLGGPSVYGSFGRIEPTLTRYFDGGSGGFVTSGGDKEAPEDKASNADCQNGGDGVRGNPIDIANGNKLESDLDFSTGGELPLYLERRYNLNWEEEGLFGFHWISNFDYYLKFPFPGPGMTLPCYPAPGSVPCADTTGYNQVWAVRPDARKIQLKQAADGVFYENKAEPVIRMLRQADGSWVLYGEEGQTEYYSAAGFPMRLVNEAGLSWNFTYGGINGTQLQSVTHSSGRTITFIWDRIFLKEVRDPAGNSYQYDYAALAGVAPNHKAGLADVRYPDGMQIGYRYGTTSQPWGLVKKLYNGAVYASFTYDSLGNASGSEHAGGMDKYRFVYSPGPDGTTQVVETNPLGKQARYVFKKGKIQNVTGLPSNSCAGAYKEATYDANGYRDLVVDFNGNFTDYDYNAKGQLERVTEGAGSATPRTTRYAWQAGQSNRIASEVTDGVSRTDYGYANGRLESVTVTNLTSAGVAGQAQTISYSYAQHANGVLATVVTDGPLPGPGDAVTSQFDTAGNLISASNSLGHTVSYSNYNGLGLPGRVVDANGATTDMEYDVRGRLVLSRAYLDTGVADTRYVYSKDGLLAKTITPDGIETSNFYDAARNLLGQYRRNEDGTYDNKLFTLNAMSQPVRVEISREGYPINTAIMGNIDAINADANFNYTLSGWACSSGYEGPIAVHLYVGGAAGTGTFVAAVQADQASEPAVAAACQTRGSAYRFAIPIDSAWRQAYGNQAIYVHGISPIGKDNTLLSNSGTLVVPTIVNSPGAEIIGWNRPAHMFSGEKTTITLQIRNTGNATWDPGVTYLAWGTWLGKYPNSKPLAGAIAPGQVASFSWEWTAPQLSTNFQPFYFSATMATSGVAWGPQTSTTIEVEDADGNCDNPHYCEVPASVPLGYEKPVQGGQ